MTNQIQLLFERPGLSNLGFSLLRARSSKQSLDFFAHFRIYIYTHHSTQRQAQTVLLHRLQRSCASPHPPDSRSETLAAASRAIGHATSQQRRRVESDAVDERSGGVDERRAQTGPLTWSMSEGERAEMMRSVR